LNLKINILNNHSKFKFIFLVTDFFADIQTLIYIYLLHGQFYLIFLILGKTVTELGKQLRCMFLFIQMHSINMHQCRNRQTNLRNMKN
jgi:hypothetical protein